MPPQKVVVYDSFGTRLSAWDFGDGNLKYAWELSPKQKWQVGIGPRPKRPRLSWRKAKKRRGYNDIEAANAKITRGQEFVEVDGDQPPWLAKPSRKAMRLSTILTN
jgi:hypothetical protein